MTLGIVCTIVVALLALLEVRRAAHWNLVARILGREVSVERAKRKAIAMALADMEVGLRRNDTDLCARAMSAAIRCANDDSEETVAKLGFKLPEKIA